MPRLLFHAPCDITILESTGTKNTEKCKQLKTKVSASVFGVRRPSYFDSTNTIRIHVTDTSDYHVLSLFVV